MRFYLTVLALIFLSGCTTTTSIVNSSPGFVIIKAPRLSGCTQFTTNIAQEHCAATKKNAVLIDGWLVPFDGDYCRFECRQ